MKKIFAIATATFLVLASSQASAQELKVKNIIGLCVQGDVSKGVSDPSCIGWFDGYTAALRFAARPTSLKSNEAACVPAGTTIDQQLLAVFQYVQAEPKNLEESADSGVYKAFAKAYPCAQ